MSELDTGALVNQRRSWMVELKMVELKMVELKMVELKTVANELGQQRNFDLGVVR